jgi:hypothetical protein
MANPLWHSSWLIYVAFGIPILIVAHAVMRNWIRWKSPWKQKISFPRRRLPEPLAIFHRAEFVALKSEITEIIKAAAANFQYAVVGSATIFTWIATSDRAADVDLLPLAVWLPFLLSALFFSLSRGLYVRLLEIARYLRRLEDSLGSNDLGWEKEYSAHPSTIGPLYFYGWICLLAGDWFLAARLLAKGSPSTF